MCEPFAGRHSRVPCHRHGGDAKWGATPGPVGSCPANGISKTGTPKYGTITGGAPVYTPPVPPLPNPLPPQTAYPPKGVTMPNPLPAGSYGNVTLKGAVTLAGGTDINHPAIYSINTLNFNGGATLTITGPVVINLAGQPSVTPVLDMTGGTFAN